MQAKIKYYLVITVLAISLSHVLSQSISPKTQNWLLEARTVFQESYSYMTPIPSDNVNLNLSTLSDLDSKLKNQWSIGVDVQSEILELQRPSVEQGDLIPKELQYLSSAAQALQDALLTLFQEIDSLLENHESVDSSLRESRLALQIAMLNYTVHNLALTLYLDAN